MSQDEERVARAVATLKGAVAALRDANVPFARAFFTMIEGIGVIEPATADR